MFVNYKALCISVMGDLIRSSPDNETSNVANSVCTLNFCVFRLKICQEASKMCRSVLSLGLSDILDAHQVQLFVIPEAICTLLG